MQTPWEGRGWDYVQERIGFIQQMRDDIKSRNPQSQDPSSRRDFDMEAVMRKDQIVRDIGNSRDMFIPDVNLHVKNPPKHLIPLMDYPELSSIRPPKSGGGGGGSFKTPLVFDESGKVDVTAEKEHNMCSGGVCEFKPKTIQITWQDSNNQVTNL